MESLSHYLLEQIGLENRQVRKNASGAKLALTFRHLAHAVLVDEERIITTESPALSGQIIFATSDKGVLGVLLTGTDDSALTAPVVDKKIRNATLDGEIGLLQRMIIDRQNRLTQLSLKPEEIDAQFDKISSAVEEGTAVVTAAKNRISELEDTRKNLWDEFQSVADRRLLLREQLKRFRVLFEYYNSDVHRLKAVREAGTAFTQLPTGECAACGHVNVKGDDGTVSNVLQNFQLACLAEIEKIGTLQQDLDQTVSDVEVEYQRLTVHSVELASSRQSIDIVLESELKPYRQSVDVSLSELIRTRGDLARAKDLKEELQILQGDLDKAEVAKTVKLSTSKAGVFVEADAMQEFCQVVADTLFSWKYPLEGSVTFDETNFDLVIGNQERGSMGKGFRAITHAAFVISVMRFCEKKSLPHPGFVILDSPLNPFKGASLSTGPDAAINEEIKEYFYRDLAADVSGNQYIILENTEPPSDILSQLNYTQFTRNISAGRYGFFPLA